MSTATTSVEDWIASIAIKAKASPDEVRTVLDRHGIVAQATLPRRRRLCLAAIRLRGTKRLPEGERAIDFTWDDLTPGLWAVLSDDNFRGKSSLLNIVQAALRGEFPLHIKPDVWSWLSDVEVEFDIDRTRYRVIARKPVGEKDPNLVRATLSRLDEGTWFDIHSGPADETFANAVADNMMEEFGFAKFHAFNKDTGSHTHGWQAIASSLFVSGPGKAVFGEVTRDGIPLRLLQMFMGLPWVSTYSAAATAEKKVGAERERSAAPSPARERLAGRLAAVEAELRAAREAVLDRVDRVALRRDLVARDRMLVNFQTKVEEERDHIAELERQVASAQRSFGTVRRTLQQITDERAAGLVFRELRPVCCPSCDEGIERDRYVDAEAAGTCGLCGSVHVEPEDDTQMLDDLRAEMRDAEAVLARLVAELEAARERRRASEGQRDTTKREIEAIKDELSSAEDADAEVRVRALEAQAAQLGEIIAEQSPAAVAPVADDAEILKHVAKVTKDLYDDTQRDLLKEISVHLTRLSRDFGIKNVESMDWTANGVLNIRQGGTDLTFQSLVAGEKLRLRIAAALAVIEVARLRHYGRHPGLLVLDSPAAQEMTADDFAALMASVRLAVSQADDVQVVVGAVARPELLEVVDGQRTLHAEGDRFLF
ncbi:hypothetical protein [Methylobacterium brachythecii]|uniref:5-methylcytosine-specific restriction endonuclease McrA n=1 Tax=Methylobacterium brachythecii TaxID=1176177 RepID=A0A7W6F9C2_9HYPH|nr:hypothetical protein [Methylobacterium brachythecii]MBB3905360.1 5-methylcytosine-specific restriction endonuclease McrA [Methylobacterium brachythecii]GLS45898.1 hypothetical protein GCM10007884_38890 [Methylobacterium brachythecii]